MMLCVIQSTRNNDRHAVCVIKCVLNVRNVTFRRKRAAVWREFRQLRQRRLFKTARRCHNYLSLGCGFFNLSCYSCYFVFWACQWQCSQIAKFDSSDGELKINLYYFVFSRHCINFNCTFTRSQVFKVKLD